MTSAEFRLVSAGPPLERAGLIHRVREPHAPAARRTVIMLHGRGGDENVMWVFARTVPKDWLVAAPRAIKTDPAGGYAWHPRRPDEWPALQVFGEAVSAIDAFADALPQLYGADPAHLYLMGFSQGAAAAFATALKRPGLIKGIAGLVGFMPGGVDGTRATRALGDLPVFMAVGARDPLVPASVARAGAQVLRAAGAQLEYHEYPAGHKLNAQGMRDLKAWWQART